MKDRLKPLFYEFGEFRVNTERRLLLRNGEPVSLTPKVFDTLLVFLENPGEVLNKERLMQELWSDSFVEESNIVQNVAVLRKALGEKSKENRFIVTIPGRGYRFIPEVTAKVEEPVSEDGRRKLDEQHSMQSGNNVLKLVRPVGLALAEEGFVEEDADVSTHVSTETQSNGARSESAPVPAPLRRAYPYLAAAVAGVILLAAVGVYFYSNRSASVAIGGTASLAVLPLKPVNSESRDRAIEFAIADSLILKFSESKNFNVKQLNAVRRFTDLNRDPVDAGRELGVNYVLASNYQIVDGRIRVTSQLFNINKAEVEQTFKSEANAKNFFEMQDAVSNEIGNAVFAKFGRPATTFAVSRGTENEEAYGLFHEAMYLIERGDSKEDSERAVSLLERAVKVDPNFAAAWAIKAQAHCTFAHRGGGPPATIFSIAEPMLDKALTLDSQNAMAYAVKGAINRDYHWNFRQAYEDLRLAIEADPSLVLARRVLAGLYHRDGKPERAIEEIKVARDLNPASLGDRWFHGWYLASAGRTNEAIDLLNQTTEIDPSFALPYGTLWRIYHVKGDRAKAYENFIKEKQYSGASAGNMERYKSAYERAGWAGVLRAELDMRRSRDIIGAYSQSKYYIATLAAMLGEKELAFQYLEEAFEYRLIGISFLKIDPLIDGLRDDPRFDDLVKRAGL